MKFFKNKLAVAVVLLSVGFLVLIGYTVRRDDKSIIENGFTKPLNSVEGAIYNINKNAHSYINFLFSYNEVKKQNAELIRRNSELEEKASNYDSVKDENIRLSAILDFKDRNKYYDNIVCHIINRSGGGVLEGYTIDKGSKEGVEKGMVVVTPEGLVGQISSTGESYSIVQTLGNENIAVGAMVQNSKENTGIIKGYKDSNNTLLAKIFSLPQDSNIKNNDIITTSGEGFIYPKGIRIGYVIQVEEDKGKIMKNAIIQPYVDFNKLEEITIIVPKDKINIKYQGEDIK